MNSFGFVYLYLFLLAGHATYAWLLLRSKQISLAIGPFRSDASILGMLLLINGFSLTAFLYPKSWWALFHIVLHGALAADEIWRMTKVRAHLRARWPFFVNHLGFIWVLYLYYGTTSEMQQAI